MLTIKQNPEEGKILEQMSCQHKAIPYKVRLGISMGLLATATVGEGGWVDLTEPIIVRAGDAFIAVPMTPPES